MKDFYASKAYFVAIVLFATIINITNGSINDFAPHKYRKTELNDDFKQFMPESLSKLLFKRSISMNHVGNRWRLSETGIWNQIRLPKHFSPFHYRLNLKTFFTPMKIDDGTENYTGFEGDIEMSFNLLSNTDEILFHADQSLKILDPIQIKSVSGDFELTITDEEHTHKGNQYFYIKLKEQLKVGSYRISFKYAGNLKSLYGNSGIYAAAYKEDGQLKTLIASKFQPTDARRAFPCFDEPHLKAKYSITIEHPLGSFALSNFPVKSVAYFNESTHSNRIRTEFEETFEMSTYLVAWAIAPDDFGYKSAMSKNLKPIRIFARKNAVRDGLVDFALDITKRALDYLENDYFNIVEAVPPKIDMIAIPEFPSGAMEHWGLVGFRETNLLFSETRNSIADKQTVALVISHELAHFWVGNLVTCAWWNDLWLNEAVATFFETKTTGYLFPEWKMDEKFIIEDILPAMWDDSFPKSHPIEVDVQTPDQINTIFDVITYSKGAAVLRMLEAVVGEKEFQNGLRRYLIANKFKTGVAADFYNSITLPDDMKAKTNTEEYMHTWLRQMNFPKVTVELQRDSINDSSTVQFQQTRFLLTSSEIDTNSEYVSPYNYTWLVYLQCKAGGTFMVNGDSSQNTIGADYSFTYLLNSNHGQLVGLPRQFTWVKCNQNFKSFYLTNYSDENLMAFADILNSGFSLDKFSVGDRAEIIHSSYQLAYNGAKSYSAPAYFSSHLKLKETDLVPWSVWAYNIRKIASLLEHRPSFYDLSKFGIGVSKKFFENFDVWQNSGSDIVKLTKSELINILCRLQDEDCLSNATAQFKRIDEEYFQKPNEIENPLSPDARLEIYRYHIQNTANYNDWFALSQVQVNSVDPQEQLYVLSALSYTRSAWLLNLYLEELRRKNSNIRNQDFFTVLNSISRNPSGRHLAWNFIRTYWDEIVKRFGIRNRVFGRSVKTISETFATEMLYNEMLKFFEQHPDAGAGATPRQQAIDIVNNNILWMRDRENDLVSNLLRSAYQ